jgi:hypothetical protein
MKNAILPGVIIGVLSLAWLLVMRALGYTTFNDQVAPIEYVSIFIPIVGVFFGVKAYRDKELGGNMNFLEGLIHGFKVLIVGGALTVFFGIIYINYISAENNFRDFSGRIFAALLIGVLSALAVSLLLTTKSSKVD